MANTAVLIPSTHYATVSLFGKVWPCTVEACTVTEVQVRLGGQVRMGADVVWECGESIAVAPGLVTAHRR